MSANASSCPTPSDAQAARTRRAARLGYLLAWSLFWLLLFTVELQDDQRHGGQSPWRPLLWTGSSLLVATVIALLQWRDVLAHDALLPRPARWFARQVLWLVLTAPLFVVGVYALRHGVLAVMGQAYAHEAWSQVFRYEMAKFAMFNGLFLAVVFGIRSHRALGDTRLALERERRLAQQAQLLQLAQQMQPHFLFNALNTVAATVHTDPGLADHLITRLAALLRAASDLAQRPETPLEDEWQLLQGYAAIMQQRFGDRVQLSFDIDPAARTCSVPSLVLQPLLENAFRHGVEQRAGPCSITVCARREGGRLLLTVEDDAGRLPPAPRYGVGLDTVQQRLRARHGTEATLSLVSRPQGGVCARIELPCGC